MQYGEPPEEAVMKLFQRALSYTDQKKLYLALINLLERADKVLFKLTITAMLLSIEPSLRGMPQSIDVLSQKWLCMGTFPLTFATGESDLLSTVKCN